MPTLPGRGVPWLPGVYSLFARSHAFFLANVEGLDRSRILEQLISRYGDRETPQHLGQLATQAVNRQPFIAGFFGRADSDRPTLRELPRGEIVGTARVRYAVNVQFSYLGRDEAGRFARIYEWRSVIVDADKSLSIGEVKDRAALLATELYTGRPGYESAIPDRGQRLEGFALVYVFKA